MELRNNMKKYLDLAISETVVIQRGKTETFVLQAEKHLVPDADLARAITMDEAKVRVQEGLRELFGMKREQKVNA
jgi:hypothetical protein